MRARIPWIQSEDWGVALTLIALNAVEDRGALNPDDYVAMPVQFIVLLRTTLKLVECSKWTSWPSWQMI